MAILSFCAVNFSSSLCRGFCVVAFSCFCAASFLQIRAVAFPRFCAVTLAGHRNYGLINISNNFESL